MEDFEPDYLYNSPISPPPPQLETLMYAFMKEARRNSFNDFLEDWEIAKEDFESIEKWFKQELGINL